LEERKLMLRLMIGRVKEKPIHVKAGACLARFLLRNAKSHDPFDRPYQMQEAQLFQNWATKPAGSEKIDGRYEDQLDAICSLALEGMILFAPRFTTKDLSDCSNLANRSCSLPLNSAILHAA
jgi:hypothetical protein